MEERVREGVVEHWRFFQFSFPTSCQICLARVLLLGRATWQQAVRLYVKHALIFQQLYVLTYEMGRYIDAVFQTTCPKTAVSEHRLGNLSLHKVQVLKKASMAQSKEKFELVMTSCSL
jgi:hypothetical protein